MNTIIDICNTPIEISNVSEYSIIETSYIFRPVFIETKPKLFSSSEKYRFSHNVPYGAIVDRKGYILKTDSSIGATAGENILLDLGSALIDKAGEIFHLNKLKEKTLFILNPSGQLFSCRFDEIPVQIITLEKQTIEVRKWDVLAKEILHKMNSEIRFVKCLEIHFKQSHKPLYFFGDAIHSNDILNEYNFLKHSIMQLGEQKMIETVSSPKPSLPPIGFSKVSLPNVNIKMPEINLPFGIKIGAKQNDKPKE